MTLLNHWGQTLMATKNSGLSGPFTLSKDGIDAAVTKTSPGAYALGQTDQNGTFLISYVGRADDDLNDRLKDHVGAHPQFKASYFPSAKTAFEKECELYHMFGGHEGDLQNRIHPAKPEGSSARCPVCRV
jgi:hypothetical protein